MPPEEPKQEPATPQKVPGTIEEIREWVKADNQRNVEFGAFLALVNPPTNNTGLSLQELIAYFLMKRTEMQPLLKLALKVQELKTEADRFERRQPSPEQVAECQKLMEELTDVALGLKEPDRTLLMRQLMPVREKIRKM
ncbi:MAG: hypothetical protein NT105_14000 [Verrucomicrobia bacterium]|nr:hypothetical protein [Verrucomicrobiota bacterium]